jgi:hypothetical protein
MKRPRLLPAVVLLIGLAAAGAAGAAESALDDHNLSAKKTGLEIAKLTEEVRELQATSMAIGRSTKLWTAWLAAGGSAATTMLVAIVGLLVNRTQSRRVQQEEEFARERHFLEVFKSVGDKSERIRLGGVGILIERIGRLHREQKHMNEDERQRRKASDSMGAQHLPTLVSVLVNLTKSEKSETLQKYVADGLAKALEATKAAEAKKDKNWRPTGRSPLADYDFQGARLTNAWWAYVDARNIDLYRATLVRAGMRGAFLNGAVLKFADLTKAVLVGADLRGADLSGATLIDADLRDANLTNARLDGARLDGARLDGAKLDGATLASPPTGSAGGN